jgi:hypothetical protein
MPLHWIHECKRLLNRQPGLRELSGCRVLHASILCSLRYHCNCLAVSTALTGASYSLARFHTEPKDNVIALGNHSVLFKRLHFFILIFRKHKLQCCTHFQQCIGFYQVKVSSQGFKLLLIIWVDRSGANNNRGLL